MKMYPNGKNSTIMEFTEGNLKTVVELSDTLLMELVGLGLMRLQALHYNRTLEVDMQELKLKRVFQSLSESSD